MESSEGGSMKVMKLPWQLLRFLSVSGLLYVGCPSSFSHGTYNITVHDGRLMILMSYDSMML